MTPAAPHARVADTSIAAYRGADLTAGQSRVLSAFAPSTQLTRQQVADVTGMLLQTVCGRARELLDAGELEELPAINGFHPLRLATRGQVDTASEVWRHACEVRWFVALPTREDRKRYLAGVRKRRGDAAAERLKRDMRRVARLAA